MQKALTKVNSKLMDSEMRAQHNAEVRQLKDKIESLESRESELEEQVRVHITSIGNVTRERDGLSIENQCFEKTNEELVDYTYSLCERRRMQSKAYQTCCTYLKSRIAQLQASLAATQHSMTEAPEAKRPRRNSI
jgi:predicted nuclease with TOPRIM domain